MSDWTELEQKLMNSRREPSADLRGRVLSATRSELGRRSAPPGWRLCAGAAAALVLWMHVSWSAVLNTRLDVRGQQNSEVRQVTSQIQKLIPDMPLAESRRLAWITLAAADQPLYGQLSTRQEEWKTTDERR